MICWSKEKHLKENGSGEVKFQIMLGLLATDLREALLDELVAFLCEFARVDAIPRQRPVHAETREQRKCKVHQKVSKMVCIRSSQNLTSAKCFQSRGEPKHALERESYNL